MYLRLDHAGEGVTCQVEHFDSRLVAVVEDIEQEVGELRAEGRAAEAEILQGHIAILLDPEFRESVHKEIERNEQAADLAVARVAEDFIALLQLSASNVIRERAADVRDLTMRLRRRLCYGLAENLSEALARGGEQILAITELLPSVVLQARRGGVRGFIVEQGTDLSHSAILAKSFGLPVVRVGRLYELEAHEGRVVLVDGNRGEVLVGPVAAAPRGAYDRPEPGTPPDRAVRMPARLWVNILLPEELEALDWTGVAGVGLFRTEALFMEDRRDFPDEEEQLAAYRRAFDLAGGRPVTIRTVDIGGDKPVPYMSMGRQDNPQLGLRAHRLFRYHPEILLTQLRAILRACERGGQQLRLLHPLVEGLDAWRFLQGLVSQACTALASEGLPHCGPAAVGPLIEVPAAVWSFPALLAEADFASVGTNDLVQYFLAVDRGNANVGDLYRPYAPAMLAALRRMSLQAAEAHKPVSICGEIAADPAYVPLLIGLGFEDLSVSAAALPNVRRLIAGLSLPECRSLAEECLKAESAEEVRCILSEQHKSLQDAGPAGDGEAIDPVCRMVLDRANAPYTITCDGVHYYFCTRRCLDTFQRRGSSN